MGVGAILFGAGIIQCMCACVWTENGFLHCRCNNLQHEEGKWPRGGSSITIYSPPSFLFSAM